MVTSAGTLELTNVDAKNAVNSKTGGAVDVYKRQELGCRLLERTSHGVKLTVQGEHLMPYVHNVLRACDVLRREADECSNLQGQCLRVGCFPSIARSLSLIHI